MTFLRAQIAFVFCLGLAASLGSFATPPAFANEEDSAASENAKTTAKAPKKKVIVKAKTPAERKAVRAKIKATQAAFTRKQAELKGLSNGIKSDTGELERLDKTIRAKNDKRIEVDKKLSRLKEQKRALARQIRLGRHADGTPMTREEKVQARTREIETGLDVSRAELEKRGLRDDVRRLRRDVRQTKNKIFKAEKAMKKAQSEAAELQAEIKGLKARL